MKDLVILRGLPGAGKSTLATLLAGKEWPVFSVDDFFTDENGKYEFRHTDNHLAYKQCQDRTEQSMKESVEKIFIHNTFTMSWEIEPYFVLAEKYDYRIFVCTVENFHGNSNEHGVSTGQLQKMAEKYAIKLF